MMVLERFVGCVVNMNKRKNNDELITFELDPTIKRRENSSFFLCFYESKKNMFYTLNVR